MKNERAYGRGKKSGAADGRRSSVRKRRERKKRKRRIFALLAAVSIAVSFCVPSFWQRLSEGVCAGRDWFCSEAGKTPRIIEGAPGREARGDVEGASGRAKNDGKEYGKEMTRLEEGCVIEMEGLSQEGIPTGCEAISAVMALWYAGVRIGAEGFIKGYLPQESLWWVNGSCYGPDPHKKFVGDPFEAGSLGCFSDVIVQAVEEMKQSGYPGMDAVCVKNVSGTELSELAETYVAEKIPVIVWATSSMRPSYDGLQYKLEDGSVYTWRVNEHCLVLCGYDQNSYYLMDPQEEGMCVAYDRALVEERYQEMGKEAVVICP